LEINLTELVISEIGGKILVICSNSLLTFIVTNGGRYKRIALLAKLCVV
jgi:hypothetical protein